MNADQRHLASSGKAGFKQEWDILVYRMGLVYQDRNELTMDGRGTGSRREACQKALAIKRWAQGPEPGQWRWQKDPLWTFVSEVNELIWWMIT